MYGKLADFIIKRYKLVIIAWVVVLFYAFPLIFKVNDVVSYSETDAGMSQLESMKAQSLIDQSFPGRIANSTVTVVIQNSNVTSLAARNFSTSIYDYVKQSTTLRGVISVDYVYSSLQSYVYGVIVQTAPNLNPVYAQTGQVVQIVYGVPLQIVENHLLMQSMGLNLTDLQIRAQVMQGVVSQLQASGLNSTMVSLVVGYTNDTFYPIWLSSPTNDTTALQQIIATAANGYFAQVPGEFGQFALGVANSFDVQFYRLMNATQQVSALEQFTFGLVASQIDANASFVARIWALGPAPTSTAALLLAHSTVYDNALSQLPLAVPSVLISSFINTAPLSGSANTTMLMAVSLSLGSSTGEAQSDVKDIRAAIKALSSSESSGYEVYVTGDAAVQVDTMDAVAKDTSRIDPTTVILVVVLVGLFFRSLVSPWVPLMTIGLAYLLTSAAIFILGTLVMQVHYTVMTFVLVVMLGAGTDYCIFVMSRYREERINGKEKPEAVKTSLMWAGESITTSGATVMLGFGALMISGYSMVRSIGMALVVAIGITLVFALTMLPSLLMLFGDKVFWPQTMEKAIARHRKIDSSGGGYFRKSVRFSLKHTKAIVLAALIISVPAVFFYFNLVPSYDFMASLPNSESSHGIQALGSGFGQGAITPTYIVVQFDRSVVEVNGTLNSTAAAQLEGYCLQVEQLSNIRSVSGPTRPFGEPVNASFLESLPPVQKATYSMTIANSLGEDNRTIMLTVILQDEPFTTTSIGTIGELRSFDKTATTSVFQSGASILVGGSTASMSDVSGTVSKDFFTMRVVVLIGIYIVLLLVMGSILIPLRLILTVLLNVTWTIAMTMIVFQYSFGNPVLWMMPLILFVVAMGLGMDYDIFLTTRIREEVARGKTDDMAISTAVERTGGIITACGLVMAGAFGSMMLSGTVLLREFGFGLAFAILLDAMILRIYLVPAIMLLLQKWNWYAPGRLQRVRRGEKARKH